MERFESAALDNLCSSHNGFRPSATTELSDRTVSLANLDIGLYRSKICITVNFGKGMAPIPLV